MTSDDDTNALIHEARDCQSSVAHVINIEDPHQREVTSIGSQTILMHTYGDATEDERLIRAYANIAGKYECYVASRSTAFFQRLIHYI